jgi:hypothetical protein
MPSEDFIMSICKCGRPLTLRHCVNCGRLNIYAKAKNNRLIVVDGQKHVALGFKCRSCGAEFDESSQCDAPQRGLSITAQRVEEQAENLIGGLPQEERLSKIRELFKGKK